MKHRSAAALLLAILASIHGAALAIPSPDLVINLFASMGQILGMLSVAFGGAAVSLRRRAKARGADCSVWPFRVALGLFIVTAAGFALYVSHQADRDNKRLHANLTRSSTEQGRQVGDASLKTLSFSGQEQHPRGISTETLQQRLAQDRSIRLIDVREQEETEAGMIPKARHKGYPDLAADHAGLAQSGRQPVLMCFSGNRSSELCDELAADGVDCKFVVGGYEKWLAEGRGVEGEVDRDKDLRALPDFPHKTTLLDTPEVEQLVREHNALFLDTRYPGDFEQGHLPGAVNLPLRMMRQAQWRQALEQLPEDRPLIAACYDKRSCFFSQILGLRLSRLDLDYRGRYTVPHEYAMPSKVRQHVQAWEERQKGKTFFGLIGEPLEVLLHKLTELSGNFFIGILLTVLGLRLLLLPFSAKTEIDRVREARRAPEVRELKKRLKDNPRRLGRALRSISKQDRATPLFNMAGNIVQLILFVVLFTVVDTAAKQFGGSLLWLRPVSEPDPYFILPALVAALIFLHMALMTERWTQGRSLLNIGSAVLLFLLTFQISAALNIYLILSMGLLTLHGILVRAAFRWHERRNRRRTLQPKRKDFGGIIPLQHLTPDGGGGNKGLKLGELIRAGFPVPGGFVVTHEVLAEPQISARHRSLIEKAWGRINAQQVAVRSSGLNEDGSDKSYAGVFESKLEVTWDQFFAALEEVRQSLSSTRAAAYSGREEAGGIVVQKMVDAEYAGVVFTEHPATSGSMMIEMVTGLGESLVSGQATPESYQFGRYTKRRLSPKEPPIDLTPLIALTHRVEAHFGRPQDIEWAYAGGRFHLLQTRDITSDSRSGVGDKAVMERERFRLLELFQQQDEDTVVLRQNELSELMPNPTPLSLSLMDRIWGPGGSVDLACAYLRIPYDVEEDSAPYVFSAFGSLYVNQVENRKRLSRSPGMYATFRLSRAAEAIEKQFMEEFLPGYLKEIRMREAVDFRRLPVEELAPLFRKTMDRFITEVYLQAEVVNVAAEYYTSTAKKELERRGENPTEYLAQGPRTVVHRAMSMLPEIRKGERTIQEFLDLFGHRSPQDFELSAPRYREDLDRVVQMAERAQEGAARSQPATAAKTPKNTVLRIAVERAQRFQMLKEEAKHQCLRELALLRQIALELDRQLDLRGGIFHLEVDEVLRLSDDSFMNEAYDLGMQRRSETPKLEEAPPLEFDIRELETFGLDMELAAAPEPSAASLRGLRISGAHEGVGRARVLKDPDQIGQFVEGEVLVARFTDPTWTPVFSLASGVVTEVGGWLSHAAILARELGVPGTVGVANATRRLQTGDLVRLHQDGTVTISQRNRRAEMRFSLNREATLKWAENAAPVRIINISRNGGLIRASEKVIAELQDGMRAQIGLLPGEPALDFIVVRHHQADALGLQFAKKLPKETITRLRGTTLEEEMRETRAAEGRLLKATLEVHYEEEFEALLQRILSSTTELMRADRSSLFLYDAETKELYSVIAEGTGGKQIRFPSHLGIAGAVFTTGQLINIPDAYKDPRFNPEVDKKTGYRTNTLICCPVMSAGKQPVGVIQVLNKDQSAFNEKDESILRQYAEQAAIAIHNASRGRRQGGASS